MSKRSRLILLVLALNIFGFHAYADEAKDQTVEIVEGWESYYPLEEDVDMDGLEVLFSDAGLSNEESLRTPANAFKYKIMRGVIPGHKGIDYGAPCGTKVPSKTGGVVTVAGSKSGFGLTVAVRSSGCTHIYAHLSKKSVSVGQKVAPGTLLGLSGNSGRSRGRTGCHLHYESCSKLYSTAAAPGRNGKSGKKSKGKK